MLRGFFGLQGIALWLLYDLLCVIFSAGLLLAAWYSWTRRQWRVPAALLCMTLCSLVLEQSYALEARMLCSQPEIYQGGGGAGLHYLGISRYDAELLGFESLLQAGPILFFRPTQIFGPESSVAFPAGDEYPPRLPQYGERQSLQRNITADTQQWLVITNLFMFWMPAEFEASLNGQPVKAVLETTLQSYYHCQHSQAGDQQEWSFTIKAEQPEFVEVVSFVPGNAGEMR